jgi:hypothetical protein
MKLSSSVEVFSSVWRRLNNHRRDYGPFFGQTGEALRFGNLNRWLFLPHGEETYYSVDFEDLYFGPRDVRVKLGLEI